MAKDKVTKTSEPEQTRPTAGHVIFLVAAAGGGYLIYRLLKGRGVAPCTPGATKCEGYSLYTCNPEGKWALTESNSTQCGYVPEQWFRDNEELIRKSFTIEVISGGWVKDNEEMGRKNFSVAIIDAGWVKDNMEMGRKDFSIPIFDAGWRQDNEELGRKDFAITIIDTGWRKDNEELGRKDFAITIR